MGNKPLIIALDVENKSQAESLLKHFGKEKLFVKVGMELFYREGKPVLDMLKSSGHQIFLDLKLHDIPTTVKRAMKQLASFDIDIVNVHAFGGQKMMEAALEGLYAGTPADKERARIVAVTQLTSTTNEQVVSEQQLSLSLHESVINLAGITKKCGLDGVVSSAEESASLKSIYGNGLYCVTPGIRLQEDAADDQARIVTPQKAAANQTDAIVVGRGITQKKDPLAAYLTYKKEWENAWIHQP
jgi:orotidine-5'-phosphate decarboxylase